MSALSDDRRPAICRVRQVDADEVLLADCAASPRLDDMICEKMADVRGSFRVVPLGHCRQGIVAGERRQTISPLSRTAKLKDLRGETTRLEAAIGSKDVGERITAVRAAVGIVQCVGVPGDQLLNLEIVHRRQSAKRRRNRVAGIGSYAGNGSNRRKKSCVCWLGT